MGLELIVYEVGCEPRRLKLDSGMVLGRRPECSVVLADSSVSGQHARIVREGAELVIEDLGSHNKTEIEGGPILSKGQRARLSPGMAIRLGRVCAKVAGADEPQDTLADPGGTLVDALEVIAERALTLQAPPSERMPSPPRAGPSSPAPPRAVPPAPVPPREVPAQQVQPPAQHGLQAENPSSEWGTIQFFPDSQRGDFVDVAVQGEITALHPRLVIANEVALKIVDIRGPRFVVGRMEADLSIEHKGLSRHHAVITFDRKSKRFRIEDLGSSNFTLLRGEVLPANFPREIPPESHLRFGPIDALFVADVAYGAVPVPPERIRMAAELLERSRVVSSVELRRAEREAHEQGRHVGEILVLNRAVQVDQWVKALSHAEIALVTLDTTRSQLRLLFGVSVLLAVGVIALAIHAILG
jgi:pSer/pThr/pTyr-binding forkhead associated (FHA) protein